MFYVEKKTFNNYDAKSKVVIITSTGNSKNIENIIMEIDKDEYLNYGIDPYTKEFIIPIIELEEDKNGNIDISNLKEEDYSYVGKFEFNVEKVIKICNECNIPFYLDYI